MHPHTIHQSKALLAEISATLIDQLLPEIHMVVTSALLTACDKPPSQRAEFLKTLVQDALHKCASRASSMSLIDDAHQRAFLVSSISAIILSSTNFADIPPHHNEPSEN